MRGRLGVKIPFEEVRESLNLFLSIGDVIGIRSITIA